MDDRDSRNVKTVQPAFVLIAALIDAVCVLAFAAMGRTEHGGRIELLELWQAAWPFLLAAAMMWVVLRVWRTPTRLWPTGALLSIGTVALGMMLRVIFTEGGAALAFVLVATGVLSLAFLGWRLIWIFVSRLASKRA